MAENVQTLVDIKNERLSFFTPAGEVKALNDVSITLKEGEVLGIVGESGSGKSVTAYSLMGLTAHPGKLLDGTLQFNGHEIEKMSEKEMRKIRGTEVSIIFQDPIPCIRLAIRLKKLSYSIRIRRRKKHAIEQKNYWNW